MLLLVLPLLSLGLRVPPLCHLVRYGLVILVEVMRDKTEAEGSREASSFLSVSLISLYAPLTGTHNNRGVGGLVCENAEITAKVSFLSLSGLILLSLGGLILLNISLVGLGRLLGSG